MGKSGKKTSKKKMMFQMGYASSLGIAMVIAIFGCLVIGLYLDRKLGTNNVFTPLFLLIGVAAGFRNFYLFIKSTFPDDMKDPNRGVENGRRKGNHHTEKH